MKVNIDKDRNIEIGDLVRFRGAECWVVYDEYSCEQYRLVRARDLVTVASYFNLYEVQREATLERKNNELELITIKSKERYTMYTDSF